MFAPKPVPVSTVLFYIVLYTVAIAIFVVFFNPLSILLLNLCFPAFTAALIRNATYCGNTVRKFYTYWALKWPFRWAKWWIPLDKLRNYTVREQEIFFNEVQRSEEVMWAMSPEAWARLMRKIYAYPFKVLADGLKKRDDLFEALLQVTSDEGRAHDLIKQYMHHGALPKPQMEILVRKVCEESAKDKHAILFHILCDYIKRCGFSKEMTEKITQNEAVSQQLKDAITDSLLAHNQRVQTRCLHNLCTVEQLDAWVNFCKNNKVIHPEAQQEMSLNQYAIFHKHGHSLDPAAISYLLWNDDEKMAEQIFRNEPKFGILNKNIEFTLGKHDYLKPLLQKVIEENMENLRKRINKRKELSTEQLNMLFDCPSSADLVIEYIGYRELPKELHKRMLERPEDAKKIIGFYDKQGHIIEHDVWLEALKCGYLQSKPMNGIEAIG